MLVETSRNGAGEKFYLTGRYLPYGNVVRGYLASIFPTLSQPNLVSESRCPRDEQPMAAVVSSTTFQPTPTRQLSVSYTECTMWEMETGSSHSTMPLFDPQLEQGVRRCAKVSIGVVENFV